MPIHFEMRTRSLTIVVQRILLPSGGVTKLLKTADHERYVEQFFKAQKEVMLSASLE